MDIDKIEKIINEKIRFDIGCIFGGSQPLVNSRELAEIIANSSSGIQNVSDLQQKLDDIHEIAEQTEELNMDNCQATFIMSKIMQEIDLKLQKAWMLKCLIEKYYETDGAGGCCHILLDDGNYGKTNAEFCLKYAKEHNDYWGEKIAELLCEFTKEEQIQIVERGWEIEDAIFS